MFDVSLGTRADGTRIRTTVNAKSVREGRSKVAELTLGKRNIADNDGILFKDAYSLFVQDYRNKDYSPTTMGNLEVIYLKEYVMFELLKINKIKDSDIVFWKQLIENKYSRETARTRESSLNAFFNWCKKKKLIKENPFNYVDRIKTQKKEMNFYTVDELKEFISCVSNEMYKTVFLTLFYTGLRKSEFCELSLDDLDINNCELHLHHTAKSVRGQGASISTRFKNTQSKRIVPIPSWLVPRLKKELEKEKYPFLKKYMSLETTFDRYHKKNKA